MGSMSSRDRTFLYPLSGISRLQLVSRIAGVTGLVALLVLGAVVWWLTDAGGDSYFEVIRAHVLTRRQLGPAMLLAGLFLLALVALITWLFALYGSFRIAGPLYRFTRNLQQAEREPPLGIRRDDSLQATSAHLQQAWADLHRLRRELDAASRAAQAALAAGDEQAWQQARGRLQALISRVRCDG